MHNQTNKQPLFTDEEYKKIILSAIPDGGLASEAQIFRTIKMCEEMKADAMILEAILSGKLCVVGYGSNGEPLLGKPTPKT